MSLSGTQTNQRMPEILTLFGEARFKSLGPEIHSVTELQHFPGRKTFVLEGALVGSVNPSSCTSLSVQQGVHE